MTGELEQTLERAALGKFWSPRVQVIVLVCVALAYLESHVGGYLYSRTVVG